MKQALAKIREKIPGGGGKKEETPQKEPGDAAPEQTGDERSTGTKSPVSVKFIAVVIAFVLGGAVFYRARNAVSSADNSLRSGNYISALRHYSGALAFTPWSGRAKEGIAKAESMLRSETAELLAGREKLARDLSEYAGRIEVKSEQLSELDGKVEKLRGDLEAAGEVEAEFRGQNEKLEKAAGLAERRLEELLAENSKLVEKLEKKKEEFKKAPYKSEVSGEEKLELKRDIAALREESENLRRRVAELEPDALRVKAVEEMREAAMEERRLLLSERLDFMNLREKRAGIEERDGAPYRAKDDMAMQEVPPDEDISSALRYIEAGEYEAASGLLAGILAREPDNEDVRRLFGTVIFAGASGGGGGNPGENPGNKKEIPSLKRALELISLREYGKAEKMLGAILKEKPSDITAGELIIRVRVLKEINNR